MAITRPAPRFGHMEALGRSKTNFDKALHLHSLPATGFILARSEGCLATVLAGGVGNLAKCTLRLNPADARRLKTNYFCLRDASCSEADGGLGSKGKAGSLDS